jgi:NitT/TauT family transport system substrate-binding protein
MKRISSAKKEIEMIRRLIILTILSSLLFAGCSPESADSPTAVQVEKIRLPMGYIPNVQYAPFYVAVEKGFFRQSGLEVEFDYSYETDGVALVGANELQFSLVSGEQVLLARAQGLPVVYVMSWWQDYPVAVASLKGNGITTPADLEGLKIGLPGLFGASYVGLRALLNAGELTEEDVTLDSIGYNQVEALIAGREDAVVIYANNEPIQLESQGYPTDVIRVADYVALASNGLLSNESTIKDRPDLVRRMIRAVQKGISYTLSHPEEAFEISKNYVEGLDPANQEVQQEILSASMEFWRTDKPGYSNPESWENMQQVLLDMGMLEQTLDLTKAYTNEFIESK